MDDARRDREGESSVVEPGLEVVFFRVDDLAPRHDDLEPRSSVG